MKVPIVGAIIPFAKFIVPVKNANTVPSIFFGVTFANKTIDGKSKNDIDNAAPVNV
jgi:hypothetical protein